MTALDLAAIRARARAITGTALIGRSVRARSLAADVLALLDLVDRLRVDVDKRDDALDAVGGGRDTEVDRLRTQLSTADRTIASMRAVITERDAELDRACLLVVQLETQLDAQQPIISAAWTLAAMIDGYGRPGETR